ncbi:TetR/AcrR family transcriptional regulator [Salibacterium salarium]|uniref:TetR/AcrR family transcriptional regulator n=1 Tax=Salibacterium salarium TaxID=284579 RepID=A0A3R9PMX7_9BACI|nr:TetR/AcrR family transcriptional regulator [Salibacterium salarium]RSL34338.1 TetR/AcrR family transcriptional regulator [Salibacterium salarium]
MTSDSINRTALELFAECGYDGTSMADIAKQVGIKKPSLYNHVNSKESLFLSIIDDVFRSYVDYVNQSLDKRQGETVKNQLKQVLISISQFLSSRHLGMLYMRVLMFPPLDLKETINRRFEAFEGETDEIFVELFKLGVHNQEIKDGDIETYVQAFYTLLDGISTDMFIYSQEKVNTKLESGWYVFWQGICV